MNDKTKSGSLLENLLQGRAKVGSELKVHLSSRDGASLHDKMRQAYWWIINNAIITPYYDIQYGKPVTLQNQSGDRLQLYDHTSFSSYVLIPLLTLFTCRRALMIGGPGRGKTSIAMLMSLLSGMSQEDLRRSILRGHPQLTITDILGAPLPADMMKAEELGQIRINWRKWISSRVKIIDEYNRIPTKTQSALLSLLAEGYAEMFDQYVYTGDSSWFLTANDDNGGGTFAVIEALKDRIDVVVRAIPFNSGFVDTLLKRIETGLSPEDIVPADIIFTEQELTAIQQAITAMPIPDDVLQFTGFFLGQLEFCRQASTDFEHMSKDTLHLAGKQVAQLCNEDCPLDKKSHLCSQTENGVSARTFLTCLHFAKALAYFRGQTEVSLEDVRQIIPWVLHEKLKPNPRSGYFEDRNKQPLLQDRVAWIRRMLDQAQEQFARTQTVRKKVHDIQSELNAGLEQVSRKTAEQRMQVILTELKQLLEKNELSGYLYESIILLKSCYSRYQNYVLWLKQNESAR